MMTYLTWLLLAVHIITSVLLVLLVLWQKPRSEGLGTAFGGGVADTLFGSSAGNILTKITTGLGITFFCTTILLAYIYSHRNASGAGSLGSRLTAAPVTDGATKPSDAKPTPTGTPIKLEESTAPATPTSEAPKPGEPAKVADAVKPTAPANSATPPPAAPAPQSSSKPAEPAKPAAKASK